MPTPLGCSNSNCNKCIFEVNFYSTKKKRILKELCFKELKYIKELERTKHKIIR